MNAQNWKTRNEFLNDSFALWDCFEFQIAQVGNMLPNQAMLPNLAIGQHCSSVDWGLVIWIKSQFIWKINKFGTSDSSQFLWLFQFSINSTTLWTMYEPITLMIQAWPLIKNPSLTTSDSQKYITSIIF